MPPTGDQRHCNRTYSGASAFLTPGYAPIRGISQSALLVSDRSHNWLGSVETNLSLLSPFPAGFRDTCKCPIQSPSLEGSSRLCENNLELPQDIKETWGTSGECKGTIETTM